MDLSPRRGDPISKVQYHDAPHFITAAPPTLKRVRARGANPLNQVKFWTGQIVKEQRSRLQRPGCRPTANPSVVTICAGSRFSGNKRKHL
ncbi:hypothetical protein ASPSYDRAFT_594881 [Aspergillus sydowii CBS 593.65]|uniref:Uncharacterized protein n=1 Tax=Aspergillus sydowii CBS 593.65 TaxID=1036612 RepID=A0A1L9TR28_9EURO|nr:uncharacterized protein ASPSYDRAFT_594881 [Aspergillus sydowii CBS 593.65]OJJ61890.1 hypothetical protein ASPSYDRAFT_594881 [Aspergillus sydowii CBS 593.65]